MLAHKTEIQLFHDSVQMCVDVMFDVRRPVSDTKYKIAVYTGSQHGAGTDAKVKIRLYGTITSTAMTLNNPKNDDFERGA